jgi:ParB family transcriptional regulator, chromosome partitioning protein
MTATIINIPLNKLAAFEGNVRKTQDKAFIGKLAASIKTHGLQQNLVVKKDGNKFAVVAGSQRLRALLQLAKQGDIKPAHPVPCKLANGTIDASEISLLENVLRENMHPADEYEAFRDLVDKGVPAADIAARFGVTKTVVTQRLKLARVSPAVLKAYRAESLTLEQVIAFAVSDDHAAQEQVLENLRPHDRDPDTIRDSLTEGEIAASDRRVKFVTLAAYEKAGGATRRDLFSEGENSVFILDPALLDRLVAEKLDRAAKPVAGEGWKWTEVCADFDHRRQSELRRIFAEKEPLSPKLEREKAALVKELNKLAAKWDPADEDDEEPPRMGKIRKRLAAIEDKRGPDAWTPEQLAMAGAVITIGNGGKAHIERGLVLPEDMPNKKAKAKSGAAPGTDAAEAEDGQSPALSAALIEDLTAHKSAALAAELQQRTDIALAAVVHAFAARIVGDGFEGCLQVIVSAQSLHRVEGAKAFTQMEAAREKWSRELPKGEAALWTWCLEQKKDVLLDLLAFCAATTINAVRTKNDRPDADRLQHADRLATALKLDMKPWFTPDAANYFSRVSKPQIFEALLEARKQPPAPAWEKLKKAELAQEAERQMKGKDWLPALLRPAA